MKQAFLLIVAALAVAGCSAATPPPPDLFPPTGAITFPPRSSMTDAEQLTVAGRAFDDVSVGAVSVNGVAAVSTDAFRTWRAVVPLLPGANTISIEVRDRAGNTVADPDRVTVTRFSPLWAAPNALAVDVAGGEAFVVDGALNSVFRVDLATGVRSRRNGTGPDFVVPTGVALDGGRLLVVDSVLQALLAVDRATGDRSVLAQGAPFVAPQAIVIDTLAVRGLVVDAVANTLFAVALDTGARTVLAVGFDGPRGVAFDAAGNRAFVVDRGGLHAVDLVTNLVSPVAVVLTAPRGVAFDGVRNLVLVLDGEELIEVPPAGGGAVAADGFTFPNDVESDAANGDAYVIDSGTDTLVRVALATGLRFPVSRTQIGAGPIFVNPRDVTIDPARQIAFVTDFTSGLISVDLVSGARTALDGPGTALVTPLGAVYDASLNRLLVADSGLGAVLGVFAATGDRFVLSGPMVGSGPALVVPVDVEHDTVNGVGLLLDSGAASLLTVNLTSGNRLELSGPTRGTGPAFQTPRAVAFGTRLLVVDVAGLFSIDRLRGDRTLISGAGPAFVAPAGVALDTARNRALVVDTVLDAVLSVDLASGLRAVLAGDGPPLVSPEAVALDAARDLTLVIDSGLGALLAVEPVGGDRVIVSK